MQSKVFDQILLILLTTLVIASYVIGFAVNENSAGGAINDSEHIWSNLQIFLNNDLKKEKVGEKHPLKRHGNPKDIANSVVHLLSDSSSWVTGQTLGVDGGISSINLS